MKTLIILPSWGRDGCCYKKLLTVKPKDYDVYVLSYESLSPDKKWESIQKNLLTFIKSKQLNKVELLGHSLGGAVALLFASNHSELISKLFLVDAKTFNKQYYLKNIIFTQLENIRLAESFSFAFHIVWQTAFNMIVKSRLYGMLGLQALQFDITSFSHKIAIPTIIFWGEFDRSIPLELGRQLHQIISQSDFVTVPYGGHEWILHNPEYFWEQV